MYTQKDVHCKKRNA